MPEAGVQPVTRRVIGAQPSPGLEMLRERVDSIMEELSEDLPYLREILDEWHKDPWGPAKALATQTTTYALFRAASIAEERTPSYRLAIALVRMVDELPLVAARGWWTARARRCVRRLVYLGLLEEHHVDTRFVDGL